MKKIVLVLLLLSPLLIRAQFTNLNPDTVCYQSPIPATYQVIGDPGLTYTWIVGATNSLLLSGQGTNQITVDISNVTPGLKPSGIRVYATSADGCSSDTTFLDIFVLNIVPIIPPLIFCEGDPCVYLIGTPVGGIWSGTNIVGSQYCPDIAGNFPITYTVTEAGCSFSTTSVNIVTNPTPIILEIEHD